MNQIILIYPINEELKFFRKTVRALRNIFKSELIEIKLSNNSLSHEICLHQLSIAKDSTLIIFFGHGYTTSLLGCTYKKNSLGIHPKSYSHGPLITKENANLLANKKLICFSCQSNSFAKIALEHGAKVVLGFDEINFDKKFLIENGTWSKLVVAKSKWKFRQAIFWALAEAKKDNLCFEDLTLKIKIALNKLSSELILNNKSLKSSYCFLRAGNCLDEIYYGIKISGDWLLHVYE